MTGSTSGALDGFTVTFAGKPGQEYSSIPSSVSERRDLITSCGGNYETTVNSCTTHLCARSEQVNKPTISVRKAQIFPEIKVVNFSWLVASLNSNLKIDEAPYILVESNSDRTDTSDGDAVRTSALTKIRHRLPKQVSVAADKVQPIKDNGTATRKAEPPSSNIKLDKGAPSGYQVVVRDGTIYDATLNQTDASQNNNKFYRIQLLQQNPQFLTWTRWGRVNEDGTHKLLGDGSWDKALGEFKKKFKDKTGNSWDNRSEPVKSGKYTWLELSYEDSSDEHDDKLPGARTRRASDESIQSTHPDPVQSKLPGPVQRLMNLIFDPKYFTDTMAEFDYDVDKMPLGKLSKTTLLKGYKTLEKLAILTDDAHSETRGAIESCSNEYFSLIPHAFGRKRPPVLNNFEAVKKEVKLLEALTDMKLTNKLIKFARSNSEATGSVSLIDRQFECLRMQELTPLTTGDSEFIEISKYLFKSGRTAHKINYKVQDIFRIERLGENKRFMQLRYSGTPKRNRRLLWHGSRCTNFGGILRQGLRIAPPEVPISGYMFGKGIYLSDISTKSANYCHAHSSGNVGLLLLCEAELGPLLEMNNADYEARNLAQVHQCLSVLGVGTIAPAKWKDASCVNKNLKGVLMPDLTVPPVPSNKQDGLYYNEYIVYDVAQIRLRYLLRVEISMDCTR